MVLSTWTALTKGLDDSDLKMLTAYRDACRTLDGVTEEIFNDVVGEVPTKTLEKSRLDGIGSTITDLVVHAGLAPSKGAARKDLEAGGIYLNNTRADLTRSITSADLLFGKYLLLRKGKRSYAVLKTE